MAIDETRCRELIESGAPLDKVLKLMRDGGASQIESMRVLVELRGMTLADAKAAVHLSPVWADLKESTDQFHEEMAEALEQAFEELKARRLKPDPPPNKLPGS